MTIAGFLALVYGIGVLISMHLMLRKNCEYIRGLMVDLGEITDGKSTKQWRKIVALITATLNVVGWPLRTLGGLLPLTIDFLRRKRR